jgi:gluconolactonase
MLFCADSGLKAVLEIDPLTGDFKVFADRCSDDGSPFLGPNDLRFHDSGNLYWTDPYGSSVANPIGSVYRATPNGYVQKFATGLAFPNGLTFSADWSTLYVAESHTQRIHAYEVLPDGSAGKHRVFAQLEGIGENGRPGQPDGIAFGEDGNLYVAHHTMARVTVIGRSGEVVAMFPVPGPRVSNLAFHERELFVTEAETGAVYRLDVGVAGQPLFCGW